MNKEAFQPEGNYYDKYGSKNPIVKVLMNKFWKAFDDMLETSKSELWGGYCLEAGCGEGNIIEHLKRQIDLSKAQVKFDAFDVSEKLIEKNRIMHPGISFFQQNIYDEINPDYLPNDGNKYDLIVCSEVLEHIEKPKDAILNLMRYGDRFIISVPHEPIWRAMNMVRGKYLSALGNTPGHIQHFSEKSFRNMLSECGLVVLNMRKPLPWLMAYCIKRDN